jgi:hypothetical protein
LLKNYMKTISALVLGAIGWATMVVNSEPTSITASEWVVLATAVATALGVYAVPNLGGPPLTPEDPGD